MPKFLTPSDVPSEIVCRMLRMPNSLEWFGIFNAALLETIYYYNYSDQVPGSLTREQAAAAAQVFVLEFLNQEHGCNSCTLPGGGAIIGQDEFGRWRMLDDGAWVEPSGDYAIPPLTPRTEPTDDEKRCAAAANASNVIQELYEALADEYATNHDLALFYTAIGVSIGLLFLPPLGLLAAGFLATALILVQEGFQAFSFLTADVWTSEFDNEFTCILLNNATVEGDGSVTFDLDQVVNDVTNSLAFQFDPTLATQRLALQVGTILKYIGKEGLDYAGSTTDVSEDECEFCDCTGTSVNFSAGTQGFVNDAWDVYAGVGTHMANIFGTGWYADSSGGANQIGISGDVAIVCGTGINVNGQRAGGGASATLQVRVTTATQVKNATWTPTAGIFLDTILWDEGGSLDEAPGFVEIGYLGSSGFGICIQSFQTGDV